MFTAANVNDRNGAVDMIDYYYRNTDYLTDIKKVLVDGEVTPVKILLMLSKRFPMLKLKLLSAMNFIRLLFFQNAGLWNVLSAGLINAGDSGKTANVNYKILFKWLL